jgi:membrane protease YdiL (CAAX protease family)
MKTHGLNSTSKQKSPLTFFVLVFAISTPFWLMGAVAEQLLPEDRPIDLPIGSLAVVCPMIAALILVRRESGSQGVKQLLKRALDYKGIKGKTWYVPILFSMPSITVLAYGLMQLAGAPLPDPQLPVLMVPVFAVVFFIAALGEETGWQGYAIDPLQERWNALTASIIVGIVWAVWHIVLLVRLGRTPQWIAWQCLNMVVARILIVWLYNNTGKSLFAAVLFHTMHNLSTFLFPNLGSHYDPVITGIITTVAAATVVFLWGPATLAQYRFARLGQDVQPSAAN